MDDHALNDDGGADQLGKLLTASNRPLRMQLGFAEGVTSNVLLPQRVEGVEAVCEGIEMRIYCLAMDARLPLKTLIGLPVEVQIVTDQGELRSICGIVAEASAGESDGGLASYQLVMRDALSILDLGVGTRVFLNQSELDVVTTVLGEARRANPALAATFEFEIETTLGTRIFPERSQIVQYNEGTGAFIRRLLRRRGISWYFRPGRASDARASDPADDVAPLPVHTMVLFQNAKRLPPSSAGAIRFHRDSATEERDAITAFGAVRSLRPGRFSRHSWDYGNPQGAAFMIANADSTADQGARGSKLAATLEDYRTEAPHVRDDYDDLESLARQALARSDFEAKCYHVEGGVRDCTAGEYFTLSDHPAIDRHPLAEREFVVLSSHITAQNNLPKDYNARVARLFARNRWQIDDASLPLAAENWFDAGQLRFLWRATCVRRDITFVPAWDARTDAPQAQLQSAVVVGAPGEAVHCDAQGRIKVRFTAMREEDHAHAESAGASGTDRDSAWVRVASSWAGTGSGMPFGSLALPRPGTEVLIGFMGGDPDKPIIIGQLYNMLARPPYLGAGDLPGNKYLSGVRSREIDGARGNQLRFDDTTGRINAQLASDHAASQLNLGYLVHPLRDGRGEMRGEGAELRSDGAVAVRGGKGVLISAAGSVNAAGGQLDRDELTTLFESLSNLGEQLSKLAVSHAQDDPSPPDLPQLIERLAQLDGNNTTSSGAGGAPLVAVGGPAGVALGSGKNMMVGAKTNIDVLSEGDTTAHTGGHLLLRSALDISLFANKLGMKLVAARGAVKVQAQDDAMELLAKKVLELISTTDWINIKAKQGVRLYGGGSELEISDAGIKGYTTGKHEMHAADHQTFPGQERPLQFPDQLPFHEVCIPCMLIAARGKAALAEAK